MFISSYRNSLCLDIIYGINCQENRKKRIDHEQVAWFEMFDFPFCMCFVRSLLSSCNFFQTKCVYMYFVIVYLRVARSCELQFTIFVHNSLIQIIICSQDIINYIYVLYQSAVHCTATFSIFFPIRCYRFKYIIFFSLFACYLHADFWRNFNKLVNVIFTTKKILNKTIILRHRNTEKNT